MHSIPIRFIVRTPLKCPVGKKEFRLTDETLLPAEIRAKVPSTLVEPSAKRGINFYRRKDKPVFITPIVECGPLVKQLKGKLLVNLIRLVNVYLYYSEHFD